MKKYTQILKIVTLTLGFLLTLTNCQEKDFVTDDIMNNTSFEVPNIEDVRLDFEKNNDYNNPLYKSSSNQNYSNNKSEKEFVFIDWKGSFQINFKELEGVDILYTPVIYDNNGKMTKTFIASVNEAFKIESYIYTLYYAESSTDNNFTGIIVKFNSKGIAKNYYRYLDGVIQETYIFKSKKAGKMNSLQSKNSDYLYSSDACGEITWDEMVWIIEYLMNDGGGSYIAGNCVEITANESIASADEGGGGSGSWTNPDANLSGGSIPATGGGGSSSNGSSTDSNEWWNSELITVETATSNAIINAIPTLTTAQKNWVNNQENHGYNMDIIRFLEAQNNSIQAHNFVKLAINAWINGEVVDLFEMYIETLTPDDNYIYQGARELITNPLVLSNGEKISISFGITKSDNKSANQKVSVELIKGLKFALEKANLQLTSSQKISSIHIMATTNGKHGITSNHSYGTAIDISRINGDKMSLTGLTIQIKELQKAFDSYDFIRENFGPYFKHKYYIESDKWNYNYPVGGHKDHIHVSIRN